MKYPGVILFLFFNTFIVLSADNEGLDDSLQFKGQVSGYGHVNFNNTFPVWTGGRYLPQANYSINLDKEKLLDFEASINLYGNVGIKSFDSVSTNGDIKPYRLWARYSTSQFELRMGLQKINFGSANILRPLMWFDQIDPRDPLKLTNGVYGILARYYFINNANIWLWGLYGNKNTKGWESLKTNKEIPEFGGRFQFPVPAGESGVSFHHRTANSTEFKGTFPVHSNIPENKFGLDLRMDLVVGCWFEGSWVKKEKDLGILTNQEIINVGVDYTFGLGNGVYVVYEHLLASSDQNPFAFTNLVSFSLLSMSYPVGLFDNLNGIVYFDWNNKKAYNFINWQRQFDRITLYLMGYINPDEYNIPTQGEGEMLFSGSGLQVMLVWNY